jgi:hypothetical protein
VKAEDGDAERFVSWKKAVPEGEPAYTGRFAGFSLLRKENENEVGAAVELVRFIREFPEPTAIRLRHLAGLGTEDDWAVEWRGNRKAVVFESGNKKAAAMPVEYAGGMEKEEAWTRKK